MGIFYGRPLALGCFLFALGSLLGWFLSFRDQLGFILVLLILLFLLISFGAIIFLKKRPRENRIRLFGLILCLVILISSVGYSFLKIDLPQRNAAAYEGEGEVLMTVISEGDAELSSSSYTVLIREINGKSVSIRATLKCSFDSDFSGGDRIAAVAGLVHNEKVDPEALKDGVILQLAVESPSLVAVERRSQSASFSDILWDDGGVEILSGRVRLTLRELLCAGLGTRVGTLAAGFFSGDRSGIAGEVVRDFRRTGTSHLMAVSGLHISILLGSVDLLLKKLYCPKRGRCLVVSLLSVVFLFMTGFSMSACRSVFMLYAVYLGFLFYEENDSLTSLFVSLALILVLSPYGVTDLGLWMSFLATLGLLTVYPLFEKWIPKPKRKDGVARYGLLFSRRILLLSLMTVISTFFLLPILWLVFGEISLISVFANLVLSPICLVFLISIPIFLLLLPFPFMTELWGQGICWIGEGILELLRWLSLMPSAALSLRYSFATPIVLAFTMTFATLLVVRLKKKWKVVLPAVCATLVFALCLGIYGLQNRDARVIYQQDFSENELLAVEERGIVSICDRSDGSWDAYFALLTYYEDSMAEEFELLTLTYYHENHPSFMESLSRHLLVRKLYLPTPVTPQEQTIARSILEAVEGHGSEIVFYGEGEWMSMSESVFLGVSSSSEEEGQALLTFATETDRIAYCTPNLIPPDDLFENRILIIGVHGTSDDLTTWEIPQDVYTEEIWCTTDKHPIKDIPPHISVYGEKREKGTVTLKFPLY